MHAYIYIYTQVILVNKMDLPFVRERWPQLKEELVKLVGHGRVDAISAAANANLMPVCVYMHACI